MRISDELRNLLARHNNAEQNHLDDNNVRDENRDSFGGVFMPSERDEDGRHRHHRGSFAPVYLTFCEIEHCFFIEQVRYISFDELKAIRNKYSGLTKSNKNYSNVINPSYNKSQLTADINDNWDDYVFTRLTSLLDTACHMFERYFEIKPNSFFGKNIYFYPYDIERIIDDETNFYKRENEKYNNGLRYGSEVATNLQSLACGSVSSEKVLEDAILNNIFNLYALGYFDYLKFKKWASEKSGYGIGGNIAVKEDDWISIQKAWNTIKSICPTIFTSSRFAPAPAYSNAYSSTSSHIDMRKCIDDFFLSTDLNQAFIDLSNRVYAAFYNKPLEA